MIVEFLLLLIFAVHIPKIIFKTLPIILPIIYNSTDTLCGKKALFKGPHCKIKSMKKNQYVYEEFGG